MIDRPHAPDPLSSWTDNAGSWTRAVREGWIASRAQATDAAILDRLAALSPRTLLDLGCGEGWLCRAARTRFSTPCHALGVDAVPALIAAARATDPNGAYAVVSQESIAVGGWTAPHAFDAICANYALFAEDLVPLLAALRGLLRPDGHLVIQTLHPWAALAEGAYESGWRTEDFSGFAEGEWSPMPWYARTLEDWVDTLGAAGFRLADVREPAGGAPPRPLSLLLTCAAG